MCHSQIRHSFTPPDFFRICANCKFQFKRKAKFAFHLLYFCYCSSVERWRVKVWLKVQATTYCWFVTSKGATCSQELSPECQAPNVAQLKFCGSCLFGEKCSLWKLLTEGIGLSSQGTEMFVHFLALPSEQLWWVDCLAWDLSLCLFLPGSERNWCCSPAGQSWLQMNSKGISCFIASTSKLYKELQGSSASESVDRFVWVDSFKDGCNYGIYVIRVLVEILQGTHINVLA